MARQRWGRRIEFFLTSVGYSVGVGDLWRFPYLVMKNGGGAFLIPIVIFNVLGAMPIVYLEMIMGQYSQSGAVSVWRACPLFKGVGFGTIISTFLFSIYYAVIIGWMVYYFIHSFFRTLPWSTCDNAWNIKETCVVTKDVDYTKTTVLSNITTTIGTTTAVFDNMTSSMTSSISNVTVPTLMNDTVKKEMLASTEQFWRYKALHLSDGLHDLGDIQWQLVGCVALVEVICFFCIFKGVKITGKVVYFTVAGPFVLLFVFLIRGAILPGADIGIKFYLTPDLQKLTHLSIWAEACMQVFVSIGPGFGGMITFASYNKFTNNCMRDAIFVCLLDLFTGFFGGFVIFSVLGHVSYRTGIPIENFNQSGLGLGFIAYPEAAMYLPPPQLWCALFFFMAIFLGIDSQFPNYEIVVTALKDEFPKRFKHTSWMTLIVIVAAFLLAIPQVTEGGMYVLTLVDWYAATFSVTIFALFEVLVMTYIYGIRNVNSNMVEMTGRGVPLYFKICWVIVTPLLLAVTLGFTVYSYKPPSYSGYVYPPWAVTMGWMIAACSLVPIPVYIIYMLCKTPGGIREKLRITTKPNALWGPPPEDKRALDDKEVVEDDEKKLSALDNPVFVKGNGSTEPDSDTGDKYRESIRL